MSIYRILGKRGRTTIPQEIRNVVGFKYNDVLSFTCDGEDSVVVKREKVCDKCTDKKKESKEKAEMRAFLEKMSPEFQKLALECLIEQESDGS